MIPSPISSLYQLLTKPSDAILQPDRRRQAHLLTSLILVILGLVWAVEFYTIIEFWGQGYRGYWIMIGFSLLLVGLYFLGRSRYLMLAVWLLIASVTALCMFFIFYIDGQLYSTMLYFLLVPFLLGSFFLTERATVLLFATGSAFIFLLAALARTPAQRDAMTGPLVQFVAVGGLVLALTYHRNRIEEDRRQELRRERNLLRTVIDNVPDQIFVRDQDSRFLLGNLSDARIMGVGDPASLVGKTDYDFYTPELAASYQADNRAVMESGRPIFNKEEPSIDADGHERCVLTTKVPLRDHDGEVIGLVGIARDITEMKQSEMERRILEKQVAQTHKLEALGVLAAGMAHEINTPVQYVGGNLRFLRSQLVTLEAAYNRVGALRAHIAGCWRCSALLPQLETILPGGKVDYLLQEFPQAIDQSLDGIDQITRIVNAMRTFSHPGSAQRSPASINQLLANTLTMTQHEWKSIADVETNYTGDLPSLSCFPAELGQAFLNLLLNAIDAIEESASSNGTKGKITIATTLQDSGIEVRIADNGPGIPDEIKEQIFDYFFTTKDVGKGTGQGLAICHNIINRLHGGTIRVDSCPGAGATFIIHLPFAPSGKEVAAA